MPDIIEIAMDHLKDGTFSLWAWDNRNIVSSATFQKAFAQAIALAKQPSKKYIYLITFTIDPKLFENIDKELEDDIEAYILRQRDRSGLHITDMYYVKELHKNGRPHWHVSVTCSRPIKKSLFKYYQRKYGNIDFSRSKGENNLDALNYMSKSETPTRVRSLV